MNIYDYTDEDIMKVLQKTIDYVEQDKDRATYIYEIMLNKMATDDGNLVVLSQMADRYLEQASRATDNLLKLASVMQKLKAARDAKKSGKNSDFKDILAELDLAGTSPFMQKNAKGEMAISGSPEAPPSPPATEIPPTDIAGEKSEKVEPTKPPKTDKSDDEIELETEFE